MNSASDKPESSDADHYMRLLEEFGARDKRPRDCVKFLEERGYSHGQARNAVYRYRRAHHLAHAQVRA